MDIIAAIDTATGCQHCGGSLGNSPSSDFCREACQAAWHSGVVVPLLPLTGNLRFDYLAAALALAAARSPEQREAAEARLVEVRAQMAAVFAEIARALQPAVQSLTEAFHGVGEALESLAKRGLGEALDSLAPPQGNSTPADPRERALWLRQHRNTGPTAQHRPPRAINPRRAR